MAIEKGQAWGEPAGEYGLIPTASGDAELAGLVGVARTETARPAFRLTGGDLLRTLGVLQERQDDELVAYPMDLGLARFGADLSTAHPFVAHATVRSADPLSRLWGHGPAITVSVMNAAWLGDLRLGPRAHPNDGLLDIAEGRVRFRERREAVRRARTGSHLPHPALSVSRVASWDATFAKPQPIWLDGVRRGTSHRLTVEVLPDAFIVVA